MAVSKHILDLLARIKRRALLMAEIDRLDRVSEQCFEDGKYEELDTLLAERKSLFGEYVKTFGSGLSAEPQHEEGAERA